MMIKLKLDTTNFIIRENEQEDGSILENLKKKKNSNQTNFYIKGCNKTVKELEK